MNHTFFASTDIQLWNTHVPNGMAVDADLECEAFETKIRACGGVDLWLLGIGRNGHIAFNEPGSAPDSRTRLVDLTESTIAANSRFFQTSRRCAQTGTHRGGLRRFARRNAFSCWRRVRIRRERLPALFMMPNIRPVRRVFYRHIQIVRLF